MRRIIPIFYAGILLVLIFGFTKKNKMSIEHRKYEVLQKEGNFEIRLYPIAIQASTKMKTAKYSESASMGFRKLAGYIFGGNSGEKKIAMTSPVEISMGDEKSEMSFTMPSQMKLSDLPEPNDKNIFFKETPEEFTASISFGGYASDTKIQDKINELKKILSQKNLKTIGAFKYLGYNSPFRIIGRRNEIIVPIEFPSHKIK
jgi:hypothetical protein